MFEEATKRKNYTESRRNNRKKKDEVDISLLSKSYVNRMENENEDVNVNVNTLVNKNENKNANVIVDESVSSLFDDWNEIDD